MIVLFFLSVSNIVAPLHNISCSASSSLADHTSAPYTAEYVSFVQRLRTPETLILPVAAAGMLCPLQYDSSVSNSALSAIALAHKLVQLLIVRNESQPCVYVKVALADISFLGIAYFRQSEPSVNIKISNSILDDFDLLFATTVHEYFHLLGFGDVKFRENVELDQSNQYVYSSQKVNDCIQKYTDSSQRIPIQKLQNNIGSHWAQSAPNPLSLLKPNIDGNSRLAECTVIAAAELIEGATPVCSNTFKECADTDSICTPIGQNLPSVCFKKTLVYNFSQPQIHMTRTHNFPNFSSFFIMLVILLRLLLVCASYSNNRCATELKGRFSK